MTSLHAESAEVMMSLNELSKVQGGLGVMFDATVWFKHSSEVWFGNRSNVD